jgi:outer membrane protein OmpA-like peptidoglycan-associated protein
MLSEKTDSIRMLQEASRDSYNALQSEEYSFVVYYESSSLTGRNMIEFRKMLDRLPLKEMSSVYLSAFADHSGSEEANYYISEQRLRILSDELTGRGIDPMSLYWQNHGEKYASADTPEKDRRVEILFKK